MAGNTSIPCGNDRSLPLKHMFLDLKNQFQHTNSVEFNIENTLKSQYCLQVEEAQNAELIEVDFMKKLFVDIPEKDIFELFHVFCDMPEKAEIVFRTLLFIRKNMGKLEVDMNKFVKRKAVDTVLNGEVIPVKRKVLENKSSAIGNKSEEPGLLISPLVNIAKIEDVRLFEQDESNSAENNMELGASTINYINFADAVHLAVSSVAGKNSATNQSLNLNDKNSTIFESKPGSSKQTVSHSYTLKNDSPIQSKTITIEDNDSAEIDEGLFFRLLEMFPDICPKYLRKICCGKFNDSSTIDELVTLMISIDYPKRVKENDIVNDKELGLQEQYEILREMLPNADPDYLQLECDRIGNNQELLREFVANALEYKNYPTMKDYLRKQQLSAQQKQYTSEFNIEKFMQIIPNPEKTFKDSKRLISLNAYDKHYAFTFLKNTFSKIPVRDINAVLVKNQYKVIFCVEQLEKMTEQGHIMKSKRKTVSLPSNIQNIPLLQEIAYIMHKKEIEEYLLNKTLAEEEEHIQAKKNGLLVACSCCYDEEVLPKHTFACDKGCIFCKNCLQKSTEIQFSLGKLYFPCLGDCNGEFTLQILQNAVDPKLFSKIAQKKALEEVKAAGIEELELCPFCDFANIPIEGNKIFQCLNPECMKESCRLCKEPSHVPLRCDEVEKDEEVKVRTYIENKMTEALLRECWKCSLKFYKEEGCNKMTCTCGAMMCYVCKQPVMDYKHFNGNGGDRFDLCPLYSDTNALNKQEVLQGGEAAKVELGVTEDPTKLKVDPTADVSEHYDKKNKKESHHLQLARDPNVLDAHFLNLPGPFQPDDLNVAGVFVQRNVMMNLQRARIHARNRHYRYHPNRHPDAHM